MNRVSGNSFTAATHPAKIEERWGCQNSTTPPRSNGPGAIIYVQTLSEESALLRTDTPQPAPAPQETMPNPCEGGPANPLCP